MFFSFLFVYQIPNCLSQRWETIFGEPGKNESIGDILEYYDKGYLISGNHELPSNNEYEAWLIKTDINGNKLWEKFLYWENSGIVMGRATTDNNGEVVIASCVWLNNEECRPYIIKIDSCGDKQWCKIFTDNEYTYGWFSDVLILDNGDILALAYLDSDDEIELVFLFYFEKNGDLIWKKPYASKNNYPLINSPSGGRVYKFQKDYIISGYCYYPYP